MDTAKSTLLLLLLVVLTAGSRVLDGVGAAVRRVVILGRVTGAPEMVVEGWLIGTLAAVGWLVVGLFVGVSLTGTVTLGVGAAVVGA